MLEIRHFVYMGVDFFRWFFNKDYFRQKQELGLNFTDSRGYYNDMRKKALWEGEYDNGVPLIYVPSFNNYVALPVMIIQYGLGSIDSFFAIKERKYLKNVANVTQWLLHNINQQGYYDNKWSDYYPNRQFYSNNNAMAQGEALSFLIRVIKYKLVEGADYESIDGAIHDIFNNMIKSLNQEGAASVNDEYIFYEYCRTDNYVVINGWIFALFGLIDYNAFYKDRKSREIIYKSMESLKRNMAVLILDNGWSYYDNRNRLCSPFYQQLHIAQFEALYNLTKDTYFKNAYELLKKGYTRLNITKYTVKKILERLKDEHVYITK